MCAVATPFPQDRDFSEKRQANEVDPPSTNSPIEPADTTTTTDDTTTWPSTVTNTSGTLSVAEINELIKGIRKTVPIVTSFFRLNIQLCYT